MNAAKYETYLGRDHQYYFRLKAPNGEIIGASKGFVSQYGAHEGIASVKVNSFFVKRYYNWQSNSDYQWYFNLKNMNGEIILRSEGYVSKQGALNGIASVMRYAPDASMIDLTSQQARYG
jgi:uncharacterized protein YegP (UPF0339 family)